MPDLFISAVAAPDLPKASSLAGGDFILVVHQGAVKLITFENLALVLGANSITPGQIRDKLQSLTGDDRLDALAIKNLSNCCNDMALFHKIFENEAEDTIGVLFGGGEEAGWELTEFDGGVATLTVPEGGFPIGFSMPGEAAAAIYEEGNFTGAVKLRIVFEGDPITVNQSYANMLAKKMFLFDATNSGSITPTTPLEIDPGNAVVNIDEVGGGVIGLVLNNVASNFSGGFTIGF